MRIDNLKIGNMQIIETGNLYGNMNTAKAFFPEEYTPEQRKEAFLESRYKLGEDYGFDGHKFFMADQVDKRGTWFEIDRDYVEANPNGWSDIRQDILIVTDKTPGVVIGHPVADCPVVMAYDKKQKIAAIGHCSAELVDKKMPMLVADALYNSYRSKDEDIATYVSACAGDNWTYDRYPAWAKDDKIWDEAIKEDEKGIFHIDLKSAVLKQLKERNIKDITMSSVDTITDYNYYSNSAAFNGERHKKGRNFAGLFFRDANLEKRFKNSAISGATASSVNYGIVDDIDGCLESYRRLNSQLDFIQKCIDTETSKDFMPLLYADYDLCNEALEQVKEKLAELGYRSDSSHKEVFYKTKR